MRVLENVSFLQMLRIIYLILHFRTVALKLEHASESPGGLLKIHEAEFLDSVGLEGDLRICMLMLLVKPLLFENH